MVTAAGTATTSTTASPAKPPFSDGWFNQFRNWLNQFSRRALASANGERSEPSPTTCRPVGGPGGRWRQPTVSEAEPSPTTCRPVGGLEGFVGPDVEAAPQRPRAQIEIEGR